MKNQTRIIRLLLIVFLILSCIWMIQIVNGTVPYLDKWTRELVERVDGSIVYQFFRGVTEMGSGEFLTPFVIVMAIVLGLWFKNWTVPLLFAGGTYLSHLFNIFIKSVVERERPSISVVANAEGYSFPSGHAMISIVCYGLLAFFLTQRMKSQRAILITQIFFSLIVFLIGISRYFINVHYLTDVVAGFAIGFVCLVGMIYLYSQIEKYRSPS